MVDMEKAIKEQMTKYWNAPRGRWIPTVYPAHAEHICSVCGNTSFVGDPWERSNSYCSYCGARMDKTFEEDDGPSNMEIINVLNYVVARLSEPKLFYDKNGKRGKHVKLLRHESYNHVMGVVYDIQEALASIGLLTTSCQWTASDAHDYKVGWRFKINSEKETDE